MHRAVIEFSAPLQATIPAERREAMLHEMIGFLDNCAQPDDLVVAILLKPNAAFLIDASLEKGLVVTVDEFVESLADTPYQVAEDVAKWRESTYRLLGLPFPNSFRFPQLA